MISLVKIVSLVRFIRSVNFVSLVRMANLVRMVILVRMIKCILGLNVSSSAHNCAGVLLMVVPLTNIVKY